MTITIHGGKVGDAPARERHRSAGLPGFEGAESLASPGVIPWVCCSRPTARFREPAAGNVGARPVAPENRAPVLKVADGPSSLSRPFTEKPSARDRASSEPTSARSMWAQS